MKRSELLSYLGESGLPVSESARSVDSGDCIVFDILAQSSLYSDNKSHIVKTSIQITLYTQAVQNKLQISGLMLKYFNSTMSLSYQDAEERFNTIYLVELVYEED